MKGNAMDQRGQFTFYRSYYEAVKELPKKEQLDVLMAVIAYALDGTPPQLPSGFSKAVFLLIQPTLDTGRKKASNGKKGGSKREAKRKQIGSKSEANTEQSPSEIEKELEIEVESEIEKELEIENESYILPPDGGNNAPAPEEEANEEQDALEDPELAQVMNLYLGRVNPLPSGACIDELKGYTKRLSADVVCHAINAALDDNKISWSYIRAILQNYEREGVRDMAAVQRREAARQEAKALKRGGPVPDAGEAKPIDMDALRAVVDKM